jgi:cytochrome c oxidase subunit I+III
VGAPGLADEVEAGRWYLPDAPSGGRETLVTSALDARPQALLRMPPTGWAPFVAAVATAAFFMLLTVQLVPIALACGVLALASLLHWGWSLDPAPLPKPVSIGGGIQVTSYLSGPASTSWWAMVVLMLVSASLFACALISYLYLWLFAPAGPPAVTALPAPGWPALAIALLATSSGFMHVAHRRLARRVDAILAVALAVTCLAAGMLVEACAHRALDPTTSGYAAMTWTIVGLGGFFVLAMLVLAAFTIARIVAGKVDPVRRNVFDNLRIFWHYVVVQTALGIAVVHLFPRLASP